MVPRNNDGDTSVSQTRLPVLHLQGARKPEHGAADCRSGSDNMPDLSDDVSDSSDDSSEGGREDKEICEAFGGDMSSCREYISQPNQHPEYIISLIQDSILVDAAVGSEGDMSSTMESISQSVHQTESLDSNVPVMRLRGGAHRINNFCYQNGYIYIFKRDQIQCANERQSALMAIINLNVPVGIVDNTNIWYYIHLYVYTGDILSFEWNLAKL